MIPPVTGSLQSPADHKQRQGWEILWLAFEAPQYDPYGHVPSLHDTDSLAERHFRVQKNR